MAMAIRVKNYLFILIQILSKYSRLESMSAIYHTTDILIHRRKLGTFFKLYQQQIYLKQTGGLRINWRA